MVNNEGHLALADLGLSVKKSSVGANQDGRPVCTLVYQSPEQLFGVEQGFSEKADIWSLGCIFYELLTGSVFFRKAQTEEELVSMITRYFGSEEFDGWEEVRSTPRYKNKAYLIQKHKTLFNHLRQERVALDADALALLEWMCQLNPARRPSAVQILAHPFLTEAGDGGSGEGFVEKFPSDSSGVPHSPWASKEPGPSRRGPFKPSASSKGGVGD